MSIIDQFKKLYNEVFDANGNIKPCGRRKCIELIELAKQIKPNNNYGNNVNGFLNIIVIKDLYNELV